MYTVSYSPPLHLTDLPHHGESSCYSTNFFWRLSADTQKMSDVCIRVLYDDVAMVSVNHAMTGSAYGVLRWPWPPFLHTERLHWQENAERSLTFFYICSFAGGLCNVLVVVLSDWLRVHHALTPSRCRPHPPAFYLSIHTVKMIVCCWPNIFFFWFQSGPRRRGSFEWLCNNSP